MGTYLNPGSKGFQESLNSDIYVDKTGLIEKTNAKINTLQKYLCISRPRRFGKSIRIAADDRHIRAETGKDVFRQSGRRAVGAIDDDFHTVETDSGGRTHEFLV